MEDVKEKVMIIEDIPQNIEKELDIECVVHEKQLLHNALGRQQNPALYDFIARILEEIYPDEWDIQCDETQSRYNVFIRFPQFEIRNSKNSTHTIRGMFIYFGVSINGNKLVDSLRCARSMATQAEVNQSYMHSHCCSFMWVDKYYIEWGGFCLGSAPLGMLQADCRTTNILEIPDTFEAYVASIDAFLRWESLEGGPHRRMYRLYTDEAQNSNARHYASQSGSYKEIAETVIEYAAKQGLLLSLTVDDNYVEHTNFTTLLEQIELSSLPEDFKHKYTFFRTDRGNALDYTSYLYQVKQYNEYLEKRDTKPQDEDKEKINIIYQRPTNFYFKGEQIISKVYINAVDKIPEIPEGRVILKEAIYYYFKSLETNRLSTTNIELRNFKLTEND